MLMRKPWELPGLPPLSAADLSSCLVNVTKKWCGKGRGAHERLAGQGGVVFFDVEEEALVEVVAPESTILVREVNWNAVLFLMPEEGEHGVDVGVVLMQRGLAWLGLDEQFASEACGLIRYAQVRICICKFVTYGVGMVCNRLEERRQVLLFFVHARIEQRVVALAAAPQHVICPAEEVRRFERLFHLPCGVGEHAEIGVGGGAVFVPCRMLHKNSVRRGRAYTRWLKRFAVPQSTRTPVCSCLVFM
jgi:hypothetical protein